MLFIGGTLVPSAPTKRGCTNTAAHAACIEAAQAAVERSVSHLCKCTHNKRITAIIFFYCLSIRDNSLNLLISNPMPDYMLA